ncbi:Cytochrome b5-related protein [Gryllus bimaculatus]|nr:Cytochrome b5-related protein [Gryllus bimaculatus]
MAPNIQGEQEPQRPSRRIPLDGIASGADSNFFSGMDGCLCDVAWYDSPNHQGTDITEAFEAHHISQTAEYLLPRFFVRKITTPRNSPYTFHKDGFYCTLRKRVFETLKGKVTGPTRHSTITADSLLVGALLTAVLAGYFWSFTLGTISGIYLALTTVSAHNFFHQKNNFRMYYFDLSLMSSRHWRVSHALSHHLFPNSVLDLEISLFEPILQYLPKENKTFWGRYGPWIYSPLVYAFLFHVQYIVRMIIYAKGFDKGPYKTDFIPFIIPSLIYLYGGCQIQDALIMWFWITIVSSFTFSLIGLNAAHHHPDIFHDGDKPREDLDWGVQQLDAVQERPVIARSHFLALVTFGNHGLHHLFPTLDHGRLDKLMPVFLKTCEEFNADFKENTVIGLFKGQFQQCARNTPNLIPPGGKKK